jgi:2-hydroxy-7-methoxy-5-methyl-1-naphthoate---CoA ligase
MDADQPSRTGVVPWSADTRARYVAAGCWTGAALGDRLAAAARATPDAECLVDGDVRFTFAELMARADGAAIRLRASGLRADDRVVLQLPNGWEFVVLLVACLRLGAIAVPALPAHRRTEIAALVAHTQARAIVVPDALKDFDHRGMAEAVAAAAPSVELVVVAGAAPGACLDARALCAPAPDPAAAARELDAAAPDAAAAALLLLSGGTSGVLKMVARTHDDLGYMMGLAADVTGTGPGSTYMAVLPLGHGFPVMGPGVLGTLIAGGRVVLCASPAPEAAFAVAAAETVTITSVVPAVVQRWLEHAASGVGGIGPLLLQVGGSRLPDATAARVAPELGCRLQQVYGMSEGLLCMTRPGDPPEVVGTTQGRPVSPYDELRVVDELGEPVALGEPGILLTRGPYTTRGYYCAAPELNRSAFVEGWYRTGDVVRLRADGNLTVEGRDKDVINRGGEKITAEEIENLAYRVPGVRLAAAVAMPDPQLGERICLYAVLEAGTVVALADVRAVMAAAGVARFKLPDRLVAVDELPVTPIGKIDKRRLRADVAARLGTERAA